MTKEICHGCTDPAAHVEPPLGWENHECEKEKHEDGESAEIKVCEGCTDSLDDCNFNWHECKGNCPCTECVGVLAWQTRGFEDSGGEVAKKLAAIDRKENEEAWRKQAPKLGIHPDMHVKKSEREALGFFEEDRFV